jgi:hypothetical protein
MNPDAGPAAMPDGLPAALVLTTPTVTDVTARTAAKSHLNFIDSNPFLVAGHVGRSHLMIAQAFEEVNPAEGF